MKYAGRWRIHQPRRWINYQMLSFSQAHHPQNVSAPNPSPVIICPVRSS
jgi:hypothetical protein